MSFIKLVTPLFFLFLASCSGGSSDSEECGPNASCLPLNLNPLVQFSGTYGQSCFVDLGSNPTTIQLTIGGDEISTESIEYADQSCTQPISNIKQTLSVSFPGGVTQTTRGVAEHIDLTLIAISFDGEQEVTENIDDVPVLTLILLDEPFLFFGSEDQEDPSALNFRPSLLDSEPFVRL